MHTHQLLEYSSWTVSLPNQHFQLFSVPSLKAQAGHVDTVCLNEIEAPHWPFHLEGASGWYSSYIFAGLSMFRQSPVPFPL